MILSPEVIDSVIAAIIIDALGSFFTHDLSYVMYAILIFIQSIKIIISEGRLSKLPASLVWDSLRSSPLVLRGEVFLFYHVLRMTTVNVVMRKTGRKGCTLGGALSHRPHIAEDSGSIPGDSMLYLWWAKWH
jgi:hypothetical protein